MVMFQFMLYPHCPFYILTFVAYKCEILILLFHKQLIYYINYYFSITTLNPKLR